MTFTLMTKLVSKIDRSKQIWCPTVQKAHKTKMTLILKLDLDVVKMYHHTKNEVFMSRHSKVIARTDRQIHTQTV